VDPGSNPSSHSGTLHGPELPWVGPAFPPGAQSLVQAVTSHFHYRYLGSWQILQKNSVVLCHKMAAPFKMGSQN